MYFYTLVLYIWDPLVRGAIIFLSTLTFKTEFYLYIYFKPRITSLARV